MLLVVVGHAGLVPMPSNDHPVMSFVVMWIYSFHMPLFFCLSGFLFWKTRISRGAGFLDTLRDKSSRLLVPFAAFTIATFALKSALPGLVNRTVGFDWATLVNSFAFPNENPLRELWFVAALFWMFLLHPVYRWALPALWRRLVVMASVVAISLHYPADWTFLGISFTLLYLPYFVLGTILAADVDFTPSFPKIAGAALLVVSAEAWRFQQGTVALLLGASSWILLLFFLAPLVGRVSPGLFASFRNYTFQIFLLGIFFQMAVRSAFRVVGDWYPVFVVISIATGVYGPVLIARIASRMPKWVRMPLGL